MKIKSGAVVQVISNKSDLCGQFFIVEKQTDDLSTTFCYGIKNNVVISKHILPTEYLDVIGDSGLVIPSRYNP